jgi:hypothetical protein
MFQSLKGFDVDFDSIRSLEIVTSGGFQSLKGCDADFDIPAHMISVAFNCFNP